MVDFIFMGLLEEHVVDGVVYFRHMILVSFCCLTN